MGIAMPLPLRRLRSSGGTDRTDESLHYMWMKKYLLAQAAPKVEVDGLLDVHELRQYAVTQGYLTEADDVAVTAILHRPPSAEVLSEVAASNADEWVKLGDSGGGEREGATYAAAECYVQALTVNPEHSDAWLHLGLQGGGRVGDRDYSEVECYAEAASYDPTNYAAWMNFGIEGG